MIICTWNVSVLQWLAIWAPNGYANNVPEPYAKVAAIYGDVSVSSFGPRIWGDETKHNEGGEGEGNMALAETEFNSRIYLLT